MYAICSWHILFIADCAKNAINWDKPSSILTNAELRILHDGGRKFNFRWKSLTWVQFYILWYRDMIVFCLRLFKHVTWCNLLCSNT